MKIYNVNFQEEVAAQNPENLLDWAHKDKVIIRRYWVGGIRAALEVKRSDSQFYLIDICALESFML